MLCAPERPPLELALLNTYGFLCGSRFPLKQSCSFVAFLPSASCKAFLELLEVGQYHTFKSLHVYTQTSACGSSVCLG